MEPNVCWISTVAAVTAHTVNHLLFTVQNMFNLIKRLMWKIDNNKLYLRATDFPDLTQLLNSRVATPEKIQQQPQLP
jgi:hypothetical protein